MEKAQEIFEAAVQAEEAGDSDRAIQLYEQSSLIDPRDPLPLFKWALLLNNEGKWNEAICVGRQVTKLRPRAHLTYCLIARCYAGLGRLTMAERFFRKAATLKKTPETLLFLGFALNALERNDEAEECFREALGLDPNNPETHLNLGRVHKAKGQIALAEEHFKRAIELDKKYALAYADLGELVAGQKDRTKEAAGWLKHAVDHNPDDGFSRAHLANALWKLRRLKAAEEQYRKLLELWPNNALSYWCYGDFLACERNDFSTAEWYLRKAVEIEPKNEIAMYFLGKHLQYMDRKEMDRKEEAKKLLTDAARKGHTSARELLQQLKSTASS